MPYDEGLSTHISPESCVGNGSIISKALNGGSAGWVLSPIRCLNPSADVLQVCRRPHFMNRYGEGYEGSAWSETSCMHGNCLGWNREALYQALLIVLSSAWRAGMRKAGHIELFWVSKVSFGL